MMVKNGHASIRDVGFAPPVGTPAGVEVMSLSELHARVPPGSLVAPQRPSFHHLIALDHGKLAHTVDFTRYVLQPNEWLWTRPGQVQQWGELGPAEGTVVMFEPRFVDPPSLELARVDDAHSPVLRVPSDAEAAQLGQAIHHLTEEFGAPRRRPIDVHIAVLRHLLDVLLLRLAHLDSVATAEANQVDTTFRRFLTAVEEHFTSTRRLIDYARHLGYSTRTLSRATEAATGMGAKRFIDRRVILEAQRLLAHTNKPATGIAAELGFPSATHFGKFFHQHTGQTPIDFRHQIRGTASHTRP